MLLKSAHWETADMKDRRHADIGVKPPRTTRLTGLLKERGQLPEISTEEPLHVNVTGVNGHGNLALPVEKGPLTRCPLVNESYSPSISKRCSTVYQKISKCVNE